MPRLFNLQNMAVALVLAALLVVAGCGSDQVSFVYPDEAVDFQVRSMKMPVGEPAA